MTKVKICGLSEPETLRAAVTSGADWISFVFVPTSPRCITTAAAASLLLGIGDAVPVALLADPGDAFVDDVVALGLRTLQLHGAETPDRVADLKARTGAQVWKALGVAERADLARCDAYAAADLLLIDAKPPNGADRTGGHGTAFDWSILSGWTPPKPWMLAGGLTPETVREAIRATGAPAVDVSTGVERAPGLKDAGLIKAFIEAAKSQ